jgi:PLP dependent protein
MSIKENLENIGQRIAEAAKLSGRNPDDIKLVAVTKNRKLDDIKSLIDLGVRDFGENRTQELMPKHQAIDLDINWHFIGHLQRNKVRYIIPFVYLIQSVDSVLLATEISRRAQEYGKQQDILIEVNVSGEVTKKGFRLEEVESKINEIAALDNVCIKGLMMIAPYIEDADLLRRYFAKLKGLYDSLSNERETRIEMKYLSMGMSNDYDIAVEEGSNMVRIGTAIF